MDSTQRSNEHPHFNPDVLLDAVKARLGLPSDYALSKRLEMHASYISRVRHRHLPISPELIVSMHEETKMSIRDLRYLGGDFRNHTGKSAQLVPPAHTTAHRCAA